MRSAVQPWFDELTGRAPGSGGSARSAPQINALAQGLLGGIVRPELGSPFQAPAIGLAPEPRPPAPYPQEREPSPQQVPFQGINGGGRDLGGAAKAAGLQKLGQGIESALGDFAAKRKAQQEAAGIIGKIPGSNPVFGQPSSPASPGATPGQDEPASTPYTPSPVGSVSDVPIFGQPAGQEARGAVPPIGGGGALPTFAANARTAPAPQSAQVGSGLFGQLVGLYQSHGWTPQQAINIASVQMKGEGAGLGSGGADAASGGSNGISQWSADRWGKGVDWMQAHGFDPRSAEGQAAWTTQELRTTYQNADPSSISSLVNNYESPRADLRAGEIARSQNYANQISPGKPQTGPAYSDETWNNRPQYDYGQSSAAPAPASSDFHPIGGSASDIPDYRNAIATVESRGSGDYGAVNSSTGALGRYQVMPANLAQWTQQALGHPMTPQQFLASPEAQDAVFDRVFGGYVDKYGPSGAAAAWNVGATAFSKGNTDPDYVAKFNAALDQQSSNATSSPPLPPARPPDINSSPDAGYSTSSPTSPVSPQSMNTPDVNPLAAALAGQGDPNNPQMSPGIVEMLNAQPYGFDALFGAPAPELGDLFNYG